ncbi:lipocalin-like domain-containing protein [Ectothiorhodospira haloalkaliphila]|uniref:lipocalin-like domain-containing protein n=1 Tax=Ectothiorhodospira haloalkaliphila TaxID=421628 RepID=UPI00046CB2CE|nr:lipocalin-like domain-containing protein [Ectothiorhodospira haloalkaliphila]
MMIRRWSVVGVTLLTVLWLMGCGEGQPDREDDTLAVSQALGGDDMEGYARAVEPREFRFPQDHVAHPEYRNEWWYVTGNLDDAEGRRFGFQITFFRFALSPTPPESESTWATNQGWMAHLAVTDVNGDRHRALERFSRGAAGLAGAELDPFRVWLDDWELGAEAGNDFPWRLVAAEGDLALDLRLEPLKDKVFQGDRGLSQKSPEPGNASYYFSMTRLDTEGTLSLGGREYSVSGLSWMDREWSTSVLGESQVGWDWFSLQLDDGHDVMVYELRLEDGGVDPLSKGLWVEPDSQHQVIPHDAFELQVLRTWTSPAGSTYPVAWRLRLLEQERDLEIRAVREDQEMDLTVRYWEGAVDVFEAGEPAGRGFVEMTAY